jgi:phosphate transport system permease protein
LFGLYSAVNAARLLNDVVAAPELVGERVPFSFPLSDDADLYLKGLATDERRLPGAAPITLDPSADGRVEIRSETSAPVFAEFVDIVRVRLEEAADEARQRARRAREAAQSELDADARDSLDFEARRADALAERLSAEARSDNVITLGPQTASLMLRAQGGVLRVNDIRADARQATGEWLIEPDAADRSVESWSLWLIETPAFARRITDRQIVWARALKDRGLVQVRDQHLACSPTLTAASRSWRAWHGRAGIGSILTMVITMLLAVPIGVGAAIYLEEFAPKNRLTDFIEVNINNLAAVPSIVFGLAGARGLHQQFGLPRSAPLVGGMVLALMTLPTVIISSRAALKAVPPSDPRSGAGRGRLENPGGLPPCAAAGRAGHSDRFDHRPGAGLG